METIIRKYRQSKDISIIEKALGYKKGDLQGVEDDLYLFKVEGSNFKFEMPSGNEIGTNDLWIPGGKI